jgi:hypothetical protein
MKGTIPVNMKSQQQQEDKTRSRVYEMIVSKINSSNTAGDEEFNRNTQDYQLTANQSVSHDSVINRSTQEKTNMEEEA